MESGQWTAPWSGAVEVQEAGQILEEYLLQGSFANIHFGKGSHLFISFLYCAFKFSNNCCA
jgi:hypothetical protein